MKLKTLASLSLITLVALLGLAARAQTFGTIYAFNGVDGGGPASGVTIRAGVLYGTTPCLQGCGSGGTVYLISRVGSNWAHTTIAFLSAQHGQLGPAARPVFGPDNHLYGTTQAGGPQGDGTVFALTPQVSICRTANCFWAETTLHQFSGSPDGQYPGFGDLIWDPMGDIYGTTQNGGTSDLGTVYEMTKSGNNWTETPIYSFTGPDGDFPFGGVILDSSGNLFGTTASGGLYGYGTVFELTYTKGTGWTETVLYNFQNLSDGEEPLGGLVMDAAGNLYGSAAYGGSEGGGTVFELSPVGNTWAFTLLYSLSGQQDMYCPEYTLGPNAPLTIDGAGNLYGTTFCDGANDLGNIFKLTNTQNGWEYTSLHDFAGGTDGAWPASNVTIDTDGTLYGTATHGGMVSGQCGGSDGCGVVWMLKP
ncbi:MAG: choice-of-anchor tandem repeat GloVer-containing protein [Candidatus Korobacteraceae bacterium]